MNGLFITHDVGLYGASKSLGQMLKGLVDLKHINIDEIYLIYNKKHEIKNKFYNEIGNKKQLYLPFSMFYEGSEISVMKWIKSIIKTSISLISWKINFLKKEEYLKYDFIYLNSFVLWPLLLVIPNDVKKVICIREIIKEGNLAFITKKIVKIIDRKSDVVIAIDKKSANIFINNGCEKIQILKNPFDMREVNLLKESKYNYLCNKYKIDADKIKISIIGRVEQLKGQDFFIRLADKLKSYKNLQFIIIGKGIGNYYNSILNQGENRENIKILGEIENIHEIYAINDIVIRCDNFLPLGRSVWESYYSSNQAIIPYEKNDDLEEISSYIENGIYLYEVRNMENLTKTLLEVIDNLERIKKINRQNQNIEEHCESFLKIICDVKNVNFT